MASKMSERLNFKSVEELLGVVNEEAAMDIEIYKISGFKGHPFKVIDDEKMQELVESIKVNGVLSPVLIRPTGMDTYEMISGHRRLHAAQLAGLTATAMMRLMLKSILEPACRSIHLNLMTISFG